MGYRYHTDVIWSQRDDGGRLETARKDGNCHVADAKRAVNAR